jgi:hypothetical protein
MISFNLLNHPDRIIVLCNLTRTRWGIIVIIGMVQLHMPRFIAVVQWSPYCSSEAPSSVFVYHDQLACLHACQRPIQTARPVSVVHVDLALPVRRVGTCHHPTGAVAQGEQSGCWRVRLLVSGAAKTARLGRACAWRDRGRGRGLEGTVKERTGLVASSCVL